MQKLGRYLASSKQEAYQTIAELAMHRDRYGRFWALPERELCPECGQPDSCGDCTHEKLEPHQVRLLGGRA
jgi:hypothetical protein